MKTYLDHMNQALQSKLGVTNVESLEYMSLPYSDRAKYNLTKVIGNKNLSAGRFKTEEDVDKNVEAFLEVELP